MGQPPDRTAHGCLRAVTIENNILLCSKAVWRRVPSLGGEEGSASSSSCTHSPDTTP